MWWPGAVGAAQTLTDLQTRPMAKAYEVPGPGELFDPAIFRLGSPCKRNHLWDEGVTLRKVKDSKCPLCDRIDALYRHAKQKAQDVELWKAKHRDSTRRHREKHGRESRSSNGFDHGFLEANGFSNRQGPAVAKLLSEGFSLDQIRQRFAVDAALRTLRPSPSVAKLIYLQQMEYWRQHPDDRVEYLRRQNLRNHHWRYMTDESFRLYNRSKSRRRKAQQRGSTALMLSPDQLWRRWVQFSHTCAYCGVGGDLHVEHVIPISKGGEHHLGNIVPACQRCNFSKGKADAEQWYRAQPWFSEARWHKIQTVLARSQPTTEQLSITLSL